MKDSAAETSAASRATLGVSIAICVASVAMHVWAPFMPLYLLELGAASQADAVWWMAVAMSCQGITSFVSAPLWGVCESVPTTS